MSEIIDGGLRIHQAQTIFHTWHTLDKERERERERGCLISWVAFDTSNFQSIASST